MDFVSAQIEITEGFRFQRSIVKVVVRIHLSLKNPALGGGNRR